jgi:hypothetical protein
MRTAARVMPPSRRASAFFSLSAVRMRNKSSVTNRPQNPTAITKSGASIEVAMVGPPRRRTLAG